MIAELYSRPLSPEIKAKLIEFIEAYIETLTVREVDERAEIAKKKAIEVLNTDIDILVFVTTLITLIQAFPLLGRLTKRELAELVVETAEKARERDKSFRPGGSKKKS